MLYLQVQMPKEPYKLYAMVQYFMPHFLRKITLFPWHPSPSPTRGRSAVALEDEVSLPPQASLALMTVALSICSMEDFQCLWKVRNFSKMVLIRSKSIKKLFSHFSFATLHHFLSSCLSSFLPIRKLKITHNLPKLLRSSEHLFFTFQVNTVAWYDIFG